MRKVSSLLKANCEAYILISSLHTLTPLMKQHVLLDRLIIYFIQKEKVTMKSNNIKPLKLFFLYSFHFTRFFLAWCENIKIQIWSLAKLWRLSLKYSAFILGWGEGWGIFFLSFMHWSSLPSYLHLLDSSYIRDKPTWWSHLCRYVTLYAHYEKWSVMDLRNKNQIVDFQKRVALRWKRYLDKN